MKERNKAVSLYEGYDLKVLWRPIKKKHSTKGLLCNLIAAGVVKLNANI